MNRKYIVFLLVLLAVMIAVEYQLPRRFVWQPTFAHTDRQPYGCYVFDSVLATTMPCGYTVSRKSLTELSKELKQPHGIIITTGNTRQYGIATDVLYRMAEKGCVIMVAGMSFDTDLTDTLNASVNWVADMKASAAAKLECIREKVLWLGDEGIYPPTSFMVYSQLLSVSFSPFRSQPLIVSQDSQSVHQIPPSPNILAVSNWQQDNDSTMVGVRNLVVYQRVGKGEVILVGMPLMLTNYGILDSPVFVGRLLNRMKHLPVIRTEAYLSADAIADDSPLVELLKRPPLRWALYLSVIGIVLLMATTARRRQRAIPVMKPPRNEQVAFVKLIGTLQYQKNKK